MRTCPKVRGIAAHYVRLCSRNGETTAGLTELTINCNNSGLLLKKNLTRYSRDHRSVVSSFHI